jgi:hypothetical protein
MSLPLRASPMHAVCQIVTDTAAVRVAAAAAQAQCMLFARLLRTKQRCMSLPLLPCNACCFAKSFCQEQRHMSLPLHQRNACCFDKSI